MTQFTKEEQEKIKEKLQYIGLDLTQIPSFIENYKPLDYRPLKSYDDKGYKVYRYVPIREIQILLTPTNRLNTIQEKYALAAPLISYLNPIQEEDIIRHTTFLKIIQEMKIEEIEQIKEEQERFAIQPPFKVKFSDNYLWQIYYSDTTDTYFMLVPTEDLDYSMFFYLIKRQIEVYQKDSDEMIYVPICHENYSMQYLKKSEMTDIEKYLWLFTKQWPLVYEVYDKQNQLSIQIVGEITCYENITSFYKIKLQTKEEAGKFYKLIKALFILQTELPNRYQFHAKINAIGAIEFEYQNEIINYEDLAWLLNKEYQKMREQIAFFQEEQKKLLTKLETLKQEEKQKEREYQQKEKEIATYLECRKTFFGKVKYFFKAKKNKKNKNKEQDIQIEQVVETNSTEAVNLEQKEICMKQYYTIEDILSINEIFEEIEKKIKNDKLDVKALENKNQKLQLKIKNATQYIAEIDSHEKSIFEFWKFANKDENLLLGSGEVKEESHTTIEKVFDFEQDKEEIGKQIDRQQRKQLSKEETDAIFLITTSISKILTQTAKKEQIQQSLEKLKEEAEAERVLFESDHFDIFGGIAEDRTKIQTLGNQKHRENQKNKLKILEINRDTTVEGYQEKIVEIQNNIRNALLKNTSPLSISIYHTETKDRQLEGLQIFDMNANEVIRKNLKISDMIYLYRFNITKATPIVYFTNSIYYDNYNRTLPIGMDIGTNCLLDVSMLSLEKIHQQEFRINEEIDTHNIQTKKVIVYEYEIKEKSKE